MINHFLGKLKGYSRVFITHTLCIHFLFAFTFLFLISCATNPVTGQSELMLVSESQELQMGKDAIPSVKWEFGGIYRDSELHSYLEGIVKKIWANSERPHLPVQFHIQNTSVPNAFALPGYVAITRGLLSDMENEAQFAAVMGHEVGHVMARHSAQRQSRGILQQVGLAAGAAALGGKDGSEALLTIGSVGSSLFLLKYDRAQEIQADRLGVKYMANLGYDANEAVAAHIVLEQSASSYMKRQGTTRKNDSFMSNLLSTHPRQDVRISEIKSMINSLPKSQSGGGKYSTAFQGAIKNIKTANTTYFIYDKAYSLYQKKEYKKAEDTVQQAIKQDDMQAPFHSLLGFIQLQQKSYDKAHSSHKKALSIDPGYQPSIFGTGLVHFFNKDYDKAIREFKSSLSQHPSHAPTHFALGKSYFQTKQYRKAVPYLRNYAGAAPKNPEIHGLLGICYDNTREVRGAVIEYRNQLAVAPNTELGNHARKRLAVLEPMLKK